MLRVKVLLVIFLSFFLGCAVQQPASMEEKLSAKQLIDKGVLLLRAQHISEAKAAFQLSLELDYTAAALDGLGSVAFASGEYRLAEDYFIRAYRTNNSYSQSLANLAILYDLSGNIVEAKKLYKRALEENPKNLQLRNNFATFIYEYSLYDGNDINAALAELHKAGVVADSEVVDYNFKQLQGRR